MPSVEMTHARTSARDAAAAAEELCTQLGSTKPKLVVMFASRDRDHAALNREVRARLPKDTRLIGASTNGEIDRAGMHEDSVVLAALHGDLEVGLGLGTGLMLDAATAGDQAIRTAARELGVRADELGSKKYVAIVIDDAMKAKKEELLLGVMAMNQALVAVGGGAADRELDPSKGSAVIHVDGVVADDAVAVALIKTDAPWAAMRSHSYAATGKTLRITKVDETAKRALEIDGKPAALRYAELLDVSVADLPYGNPKGFGSVPTALRVGREYFIRAPLVPLPDNSILFVNMLEEGSELELVKTTDLVESTRKFFQTELPARVPSPRASLLFHCSGRKLLAAVNGQIPQLSAAFTLAPPCIGFNVQFEIYCGFHINSTLTSLTFGAS